MGFLDRFRRSGPKRISLPEHLPVTNVGALRVHTAETLVVLSTDISGARLLLRTASARTPHQLACGEKRPVSLIPLEHGSSVPTLDPKLGWLIPLSPDTCGEIARTISPDVPGEYELESLNLAVVVE